MAGQCPPLPRKPSLGPENPHSLKSPSSEADSDKQGALTPRRATLHLGKFTWTDPQVLIHFLGQVRPSCPQTWRQGGRQKLLSEQHIDQRRGTQPAESRQGNSTGEIIRSLPQQQPNNCQERNQYEEGGRGGGSPRAYETSKTEQPTLVHEPDQDPDLHKQNLEIIREM